MVTLYQAATNNLHFQVGKVTDKGQVREHNKDSVLALEFGLLGSRNTISAGLFAVADGVGGNEGGEMAEISPTTRNPPVISSLPPPTRTVELIIFR
jgi:serine/threonine protein phosphatase PrpC